MSNVNTPYDEVFRTLLELKDIIPNIIILECQSTADGSMLIRMYKYDSQIALKAGMLEGTVLNVHFSNRRIS